MLTMYCEKDQRRRNDNLPIVMMAYRSSIHASTNHTPNKMTLDRITVMPLQAVIRQPDKDEGWYGEEEALRLNYSQSMSWQERMFSKEIFRNQKSKFDLYTKKQKLGIGQAAWNHEPIRTKEFVANKPHHVRIHLLWPNVITMWHTRLIEFRSQTPKMYHIDR